MLNCKNAIEDLVVEEARAQLERIGEEARAQLDLSEVAAYALNRLPTMYATTYRGWLQQHKRAQQELKHEIPAAVRRALLGVRRDALRVPDPLPEVELADKARELSKLQQMLGRDDLKWRDVPQAVEDALMTVKLKGAIGYTYLNETKRNIQDLKSYLQRSQGQDYSWRSHISRQQRQRANELKAAESREFAAYMATADCTFRNVLENLVVQTIYREMQNLTPTQMAMVSVDDVAAYALNRLPPMYATSKRGLMQLRQRAKTEMAGDIVLAVRQGLETILQAPDRMLPPLPSHKFDAELEQAIAELREVLDINELDWHDVAAVVADAIEQIKQGTLEWRPRRARQR